MALIKLTQDKFTLVDDEDFDWLNQWKWWLHSKGYAVRLSRKKMIYMHKLINNTPKGFETDHINRNKLDNRKLNLRSVTGLQNKFNTGLWKHNTSGYKGVTWNKHQNKWQAQIQIDKKNKVLGLFNSIEIAVLARKWGERAYL